MYFGASSALQKTNQALNWWQHNMVLMGPHWDVPTLSLLLPNPLPSRTVIFSSKYANLFYYLAVTFSNTRNHSKLFNAEVLFNYFICFAEQIVRFKIFFERLSQLITTIEGRIPLVHAVLIISFSESPSLNNLKTSKYLSLFLDCFSNIIWVKISLNGDLWSSLRSLKDLNRFCP